MSKKDFDRLYAKVLLSILVIVAVFTVINKYSFKYAMIMIISWIAFIFYNRVLSDLMKRDKISKYSWMILWLIGWMLTISICFVTKGV